MIRIDDNRRGKITNGVWLPDSLIIRGSGSGGGSNAPADYSPIDLTTEELDPRVLFHAQPHYFWNKNGELELSAGETWPLEYRDGVAVGRHEPELQATNLICGNQYENLGQLAQRCTTGHTAAARRK